MYISIYYVHIRMYTIYIYTRQVNKHKNYRLSVMFFLELFMLHIVTALEAIKYASLSYICPRKTFDRVIFLIRVIETYVSRVDSTQNRKKQIYYILKRYTNFSRRLGYGGTEEGCPQLVTTFPKVAARRCILSVQLLIVRNIRMATSCEHQHFGFSLSFSLRIFQETCHVRAL